MYDTLRDAAALMKRFTDQKQKEAPLYVIGQKVWLDAWNIWTKRSSKKLDVRRLSLFEVLAPVPKDAHIPSTYRLVLPPSWKVHLVFHVSLLRPTILSGQLHPPAIIDIQPSPDIIQGEEEYEVEAVLDHWGGKQRCQYLVKWCGYPNSDATWEPKSSLCHASDIISHYESSLEG
jgi:hypothetical protein